MVVDSGGVRTPAVKVETIVVTMRRPSQNVEELRAFLGMTRCLLCQNLQVYSIAAAPPATDLLRSKAFASKQRAIKDAP